MAFWCLARRASSSAWEASNSDSRASDSTARRPAISDWNIRFHSTRVRLETWRWLESRARVQPCARSSTNWCLVCWSHILVSGQGEGAKSAFLKDGRLQVEDGGPAKT